MGSNKSKVKQRIEQKYEHDEQIDKIANDYAGQLTILFCGMDYGSIDLTT